MSFVALKYRELQIHSLEIRESDVSYLRSRLVSTKYFTLSLHSDYT